MDDQVILANTPAQAESAARPGAARGIALYMNLDVILLLF